MPHDPVERALTLRPGDILFYSSSDPLSWLIKWGQTLLHQENADVTHAAIVIAPGLILEANPRGLDESEKGVAEETALTCPDDYKAIRYVFRNPNNGNGDISHEISKASMFFRGETYSFQEIFISQLIPQLKKSRDAATYGKTFCSALVQRVAEQSKLLPPQPDGKLLSPHALTKYLKSHGWERIEGARFIRSAAEQAHDREMENGLSAQDFLVTS